MTFSLKVNGATPAQRSQAQWRQVWLRLDGMRSLHGAVNGAARRSCVTPVGSIEGNEVTTLERARHARQAAPSAARIANS